jgi:hypothetical protein
LAFKGLNAELNPIRHLLALLGAHHILHVTRIRVETYSGERAWKGICDNLRKPCYLSRVDRVQKIKGRKQRTDFGKYSFVSRIIKN